MENVTKLDRTSLPPQEGYLEQKEAIEKSGGEDSEKHKKLEEKKTAESQEDLEGWIRSTPKTLISLKVETNPVRYKGLEMAVEQWMRLG